MIMKRTTRFVQKYVKDVLVLNYRKVCVEGGGGISRIPAA